METQRFILFSEGSQLGVRPTGRAWVFSTENISTHTEESGVFRDLRFARLPNIAEELLVWQHRPVEQHRLVPRPRKDAKRRKAMMMD